MFISLSFTRMAPAGW